MQDLLNRLFDIHEIPVYRAITRNGGAEQIDGAELSRIVEAVGLARDLVDTPAGAHQAAAALTDH